MNTPVSKIIFPQVSVEAHAALPISNGVKTIFLFLSQLSHYSDVLRTNFLPHLARSYRVVVFTPAIDMEVARRDGYHLGGNVIYHNWSVQHPKFWMVFDKFIRIPFVREFDHLSYIQWFYRRPHSRLRKFLMSVGSFLPKGLMTATFFTKVEYFFSRPSRKFLHYIHRYQPSLLVTATPGFTNLEAEVIMFARRLGIPTAAVNLNYDNLTSNLKMIRKTDYLSVWNSRMEGEALRLHRYPRGRVFIIGCLRFDHYFQEEIPLMDRTSFILSKGLDPKKKLILFVTPTPSNYPMQKDLAKTIIDLKRSGRFTGDPDILIRLHPITPLDLYQEFLSLPGLRIERAGRQVLPDKAGGQKVEMDEDDLTNLKCSLKYADVVVNFASTMIIEASIFDRPIINIAFPRERAIVYEYEYNKALVDTKAVVMSFSPDELAGQINTYLQHPEKDREARQNLVKEYIPYADGLSWKRSISFIQTIIS